MKRRSILSILAGVSLALAPTAMIAQGTVTQGPPATLTFEGLPENTGGPYDHISGLYGGLFWLGVGVHDASSPSSPYHNGLVSGTNVAVGAGVNGSAAQAFAPSNMQWTWNSAYFTGATDGVTVNFLGTQVAGGYFTTAVTLGTTPTLVNFNWDNLSSVLMYTTNAGDQWIMDDFVINGGAVTVPGGGTPSTVPEPSSLALLGSGLVALVPMARRRRAYS